MDSNNNQAADSGSLVPLRKLVQDFGSAAKVFDLPDQLIEAVPSLQIDALVPDVPNMVPEKLVSRIIDIILRQSINSQNLPYRLAPFCLRSQKEERQRIIDSVESPFQIYSKIEQLQYVIPIQQASGDVLQKDSISQKLTNNMLALCFSYLQPVQSGRSILKLLSKKAYQKSQDINFIRMLTVSPTRDALLYRAQNTTAGKWTKCDAENAIFKITVTNLEELQGVNPMNVGSLTIKVDITLKHPFPGAITQIQVHPWSEQNTDNFFQQQCILDTCQINLDQTFSETFPVDLSKYPRTFLSTFKLHVFMDMMNTITDAMYNSFDKIGLENGELNVENLNHAAMILYWSPNQ